MELFEDGTPTVRLTTQSKGDMRLCYKSVAKTVNVVVTHESFPASKTEFPAASPPEKLHVILTR